MSKRIFSTRHKKLSNESPTKLNSNVKFQRQKFRLQLNFLGLTIKRNSQRLTMTWYTIWYDGNMDRLFCTTSEDMDTHTHTNVYISHAHTHSHVHTYEYKHQSHISHTHIHTHAYHTLITIKLTLYQLFPLVSLFFPRGQTIKEGWQNYNFLRLKLLNYFILRGDKVSLANFHLET